MEGEPTLYEPGLTATCSTTRTCNDFLVHGSTNLRKDKGNYQLRKPYRKKLIIRDKFLTTCKEMKEITNTFLCIKWLH